MAVLINFDAANRPEPPTLVLQTRGGKRIGVLANVTNIHFGSNFNSYDELSFLAHKTIDGSTDLLWYEILNFRIIYIPEWNKYFSISVSIDDDSETTKTVQGISLQEDELSNIRIYDTEINTEDDINREDYEVTVLYNSENPKASLLNRLISDKASHYKIVHVDASIANIQRTFSFNDISIYDAFMEIAEEIDCLFVFGESDETGGIRTISVYDLESKCNICGYRGEFDDKCPKCGSTHITSGYGKDTTIFVSKENLTSSINLTTDTDQVKNCFRLEAGDDLMTATIINNSPSGSQYLWYFTPEMKKDMSNSLVTKLSSYDEKYDYYQNTYQANISSQIISQYNSLITKYKTFDDSLETIKSPITGFTQLMKAYYDVIDFYGYLRDSLLPSVENDGTDAQKQAALLTATNLSPVSVKNSDYISLATANSTLVAYAKVVIESAKYKVKVKNSSINGKRWTGNFTVENYYDEEDVADSKTITVTFDDDYENYIKQQMEKLLAKYKDDDMSIVGLFDMTDSDFSNELKKYSYTHLQMIDEACQACLDILIEQGTTEDNSWKYTEGKVYDEVYVPLYNKKGLINSELIVRENELKIVGGTTDEYGDVKEKGLKNYIEDIRKTILSELDFKTYIGDDWAELSSFRREDSWSNNNYISDGLSNKELYEKAQAFLDAATKEIYKAANYQHSISSTLYNLLIMKEFSPLVYYFEVGNWIRIEIDGEIYKLRLVSYEIDFENLNNLSVDFSDVVKKLGVMSDIESVLSQSKSIAKSYSSTKRQAESGASGKVVVDNWVDNGMDASVTKIVNGADKSIVYDQQGLLFRKYDSFDSAYSPLQIKIINSTIAMTNDNWKTCKVGFGEFEYYNPQTQQTEIGYGLIADHIVGSIVLSEELGVYNKSGSMTFDDAHGLSITNGTNTFTVNPNNTSLLTIQKGNVPVFSVSDTGELSFTGNVTADSLVLGSNGLYENNGTTSISIAPDDISILTLQKGTDRVLFFDDTGELNVKGKFVATSLALEGDAKIDISDLEGLDSFIKKGELIGASPSLTSTSGFLVSETGSLTTSDSLFYTPTLQSPVINNGSFTDFSYTKSVDENYSGIGSFSGTFLFAGSSTDNGMDATFKLNYDGSVNASSVTVDKNLQVSSSFSILDSEQNQLLALRDNDIVIKDAFDEYGNIVSSESGQKFKFIFNEDQLEIWLNTEMIASIPKGFNGNEVSNG